MKRYGIGLLALGASIAIGFVIANSGPSEAILYKDPDCGCCSQYAAYLRAAGHDVDVKNTYDISSVKEEHGVPDDMYSCHTMVIGGYVVEGHVPLAAVERLLSKTPSIGGIALPGMPSGSPGMGGPKTERFVIQVISDSDPAPTFMVF
jgi:hypothetical protein